MKKLFNNPVIYSCGVTFLYVILTVLFYVYPVYLNMVAKVLLALTIMMIVYIHHSFINICYDRKCTFSKNQQVCLLLSCFFISSLIIRVSDYCFNNQLINICVICIISAYGILVFSLMILFFVFLVEDRSPVAAKWLFVFTKVVLYIGSFAICVRLFV